MRLDDLFHGTRTRLGIGPWSRDYFERRFAERDPWSYETSDYERTKYLRTLAIAPAEAGSRVLEVGCAEGFFTALMAERAGAVVAVDICGRALARARERCASRPNVSFARVDIASTPVDGTFHLVVAAEVLYYLHRRGLRMARDHLVSALAPGGHMVLVHPRSDAERIHPLFRRDPLLAQVAEQVFSDSTRPYTITLLQKAPHAGGAQTS